MKDLLRKYNDNADVVDELIEKKLKLKLYRDHPELPDREAQREREREGEIYRERDRERESEREREIERPGEQEMAGPPPLQVLGLLR